MAFEMSLLEVLALAAKGMADRDARALEAAQEAARKLVVPYDKWQHERFFTSTNYGRIPDSRWGEVAQLPSDTHFSFDTLSHFFVNHGGSSLLEPDHRWVNWQQVSNPGIYHLDYPRKVVLFNQPNDGLVSIVLGRVPPWVFNGRKSLIDLRKEQPLLIGNDVYLYFECGKTRMPGVALHVNGDLPLTSETPILYLAHKFPEKAPITQGENPFYEQIGVFVPVTHRISTQHHS